MTSEEAFEAWYSIHTYVDFQSAGIAWQAVCAYQREHDAKLCEQSDRYRGSYFAAKIRGDME